MRLARLPIEILWPQVNLENKHWKNNTNLSIPNTCSVGEQQIHSQDRSADWNLQDAAQNSTRTAQSNMRSINAQLGK